jgi:hypothetical protein
MARATLVHRARTLSELNDTISTGFIAGHAVLLEIVVLLAGKLPAHLSRRDRHL